MQARLLLRPEQVQEEGRGDEQAHALAVEADPQRMELDLRQAREGIVQVPLEEGVVEQSIAEDLGVHPVCVQVRMAEFSEAAESDVVHPSHRHGDGRDGGGERHQLRQRCPPARRIAQLAPFQRAVGGQRLEDEEHRGEGQRRPRDGGAPDGKAGEHRMACSDRSVQVEQRQRHADGLGREPDLPADSAAPGQRPESVDEGQGDVLPFRPGRL